MNDAELLRLNLETARRALGQAEDLLADQNVREAAADDTQIAHLVTGIQMSADLVAKAASNPAPGFRPGDPGHAAEYAATHRVLCAHADQDGAEAHWLEPGETCAAVDRTASRPQSRATQAACGAYTDRVGQQEGLAAGDADKDAHPDPAEVDKEVGA